MENMTRMHYFCMIVLYFSLSPLLFIYDHPYCIPTLLHGIHHRPATHIGDISNSRACRQPTSPLGLLGPCNYAILHTKPLIIWCLHHGYISAPKPLIIWCLHHGYISTPSKPLIIWCLHHGYISTPSKPLIIWCLHHGYIS